MLKVAAFVLAGGLSSRMGTDKAAMVLGGKTLLQRAVETASAASSRVCIVSSGERLAEEATQLRVCTISDRFRDQGPLGGIHAALTSGHSEDTNFVLAVDMPFVSPDVVRYLIGLAAVSSAEVTLPKAEGRLHPLCGVYRRSFAVHAEKALAQRRNKIEDAIPPAVLNVVAEDKLRFAGFDPGVFANLNTPEDFTRAQSRFI